MMDFTDRQSVREYLKQNDIKDVVQVDQLLRRLSGMMIEELLEAERADEPEYSSI